MLFYSPRSSFFFASNSSCVITPESSRSLNFFSPSAVPAPAATGSAGGCRHAVRDGRLQLLAVGQQATLAETQELLKQCGMAQLYPKNRRDAIILYGLTNGMDLFAVNDRLFAENEETLY